MSGNDEVRRQTRPPMVQDRQDNGHDEDTPYEEFMAPRLPEQIGEVNIEEKAREVLLGLDHKLLKHLAPVMLTKDRKPPDATALWVEAMSHLNSFSRFVRDAAGKYYLDGIHFEDFIREAEPMVTRLQNWSGIFSAMGETLMLGACLLASLHGDTIKYLHRDELKTLMPEEALQAFRVMYESKHLESMKNVFATEPTEQHGQTQGVV